MEITPPSSSLRILVVDDEPAVLEVLTACLREEGHLVETAGNGEEGWEKFRNGTWNVVLTDRMMPRMTGDQLTVAIRRIAPHMPVVMVTGALDTKAAVEMEKAGVDAVVRKPFTLSSLRSGISKARTRHLTRQHAA